MSAQAPGAYRLNRVEGLSGSTSISCELEPAAKDLLLHRSCVKPPLTVCVFWRKAGMPLDGQKYEYELRASFRSEESQDKDLHFRDVCHPFAVRIVQVGMDFHKANVR